MYIYIFTMANGTYLLWGRLAHEVLQNRAISTFQYLEPGHYCIIDYPARVKRDSRLGTLYTCLEEKDPLSTLYSFEAAIWDYRGSAKLCTATFLVPCRVPEPSVHDFRVHWQEGLDVYLVYPEVGRGTVSVDQRMSSDMGIEDIPSTSQDVNDEIEASLEDILKPQHFDWAEDTEMDLEFCSRRSELISQDRHDNEAANSSMIVSSDGAFPQSCTDVSSEQYEMIEPEMPDDGLLAAQEMLWQIDQFEVNPAIHHFNWLGCPVMERSYTAPEHSLFVILSGPREYLAEEATVRGVVFRQAMRYVDPVLYTGDSFDLTLTGQNLIRAITGRTFQLYTEIGTWDQDEHDADCGEIFCDSFNPAIYKDPQGILINGWFNTSAAPTRYEYMSEASRIHEQLENRRKGSQPYKISPLRQCTTVVWEDEKSDTERDNAIVIPTNEAGNDDALDTASEYTASSTSSTPPLSTPVTTLDEREIESSSLKRPATPPDSSSQRGLRRTQSCPSIIHQGDISGPGTDRYSDTEGLVIPSSTPELDYGESSSLSDSPLTPSTSFGCPLSPQPHTCQTESIVMTEDKVHPQPSESHLLDFTEDAQQNNDNSSTYTNGHEHVHGCGEQIPPQKSSRRSRYRSKLSDSLRKRIHRFGSQKKQPKPPTTPDQKQRSWWKGIGSAVGERLKSIMHAR